MSNQKAVVFGGSGFLGSHVADALTEIGYNVTVYDLKESPYLQKNQKMVTGNILDESKVGEALRGADCAYNFSGIADMDVCTNEPLETVKNNIVGHTIILDNCQKNKVKRIVYASSVYVYSKHGSFYRINKESCEHLTDEYKARYGMDYTILRYGSLYGPRSQMWNGLYRYIYQALKDKEINYPGTGDERREYIHVLDAARLSAEILKEKYKNKCLIITGNYVLTSRELLLMINEMLDGKIKINFTGEELSHHYTITPYSFIPKMGEKITSNPSIDMGEGLLRQIEEIFRKVKK